MVIIVLLKLFFSSEKFRRKRYDFGNGEIDSIGAEGITEKQHNIYL